MAHQLRKISATLLALLFLPLSMTWSCGEGSKSGGEREKRVKKEKEGTSSQGKGRKLYVDHCGSCHQADGSGVPHMYPPLRDTEWIKGKPEKLIRIVLEGMNEKIEVKGKSYERNMPAQDRLSDEAIARILSFIRKEFGDDAGPVSADQVAELRKKRGQE